MSDAPQSSSVVLDDSMMHKFVVLYKGQRLLWDRSHFLYEDPERRNRSYRIIAERMNVPGLGPAEVQAQIRSVRSAYQREVEMKQNSAGYVPQFQWFSIMDSMQNGNGTENIQDIYEEIDVLGDFPDDPEHSVRSLGNSPTNDSSLSNNVQFAELTMPDLWSPASPPLRFQTRHFANYIAAAIGELPLEYAILAEKDINDVIIRFQTQVLEQEEDASEESEMNE